MAERDTTPPPPPALTAEALAVDVGYPARAHEAAQTLCWTGRESKPKKRAHAHAARLHHGEFGGPPPIISHQYRLEGAREYAVAAWPSWWAHYRRKRPAQRTDFELVRRGLPCKLYVDIEDRLAEPTAAAKEAVTVRVNQLVTWITAGLVRHWPTAPVEEVLWLDSSDVAQRKYSMHLVFELADHAMFFDTRHLLTFVEWLYAEGCAHRLACNVRPSCEAAWEAAAGTDAKMRREWSLIDLTAYAVGDREWRLLYGCKLPRPGAARRFLRPYGQPNRGDLAMDPTAFFRSLVTYLPHGQRCGALLKCTLPSSRVTASGRLRATLDGGGGGGTAARRTLDADDPLAPLCALIGHNMERQLPEAGRLRFLHFYPDLRCLTFTGTTRYCAVRGRDHASNNVYYVCWLENASFYQRCHDTDCLDDFVAQQAATRAEEEAEAAEEGWELPPADPTKPPPEHARGPVYALDPELFLPIDVYLQAHPLAIDVDAAVVEEEVVEAEEPPRKRRRVFTLPSLDSEAVEAAAPDTDAIRRGLLSDVASLLMTD